MRNIAVIGKNFGDEGKGLAVASICRLHPNTLVIKHNGGAQAGHTVEDTKTNKKFIHHQIGSGAEYGASTLFASSYQPDLYQLGKEIEEFQTMFGFIPPLYAEANAQVTTLDDVLLNMGAETARGAGKHGSCGMGINECFERVQKGYALTLSDIHNHSLAWIYDRLHELRKNYTTLRAKELGIDEDNPYAKLLEEEELLGGFAADIKKNIAYITLTKADALWLDSYDSLVFESGQGLLLDSDYLQYMPYLTPSKTGAINPAAFLAKRGKKIDELIYVTRSYVTRHGEGPLPCLVLREELAEVGEDRTNEPNPWQGSIRYAKHESLEAFLAPMLQDTEQVREKYGYRPKISILVTHLDETMHKVYFAEHTMDIEDLKKELKKQVDCVYCSYSKDSVHYDD